ncbi:hypothetical protein [Streptomyces alkaliterrae]|uniref:Uncharacterized protein n=1 Tax=Streptomyces alkaliterrae TaxID=2213162 RepID=A0A5P0YU85_9ACTN|nr:hypothetical protein [Streptomyces alkaliterrae]MBB1256695.1 hypothetical protein [Streptomyces alkaliterrae]MBB1262307.1 hypothetical protein [Streptomyces alkaliterrae]MQS02029.1 hypothetical protein [Streptomyces alkaliterrae]
MRTRRAVGAAVIALTAVVGLAGCADQPKDKAFGGLGDAPSPPTMPPLPSLSPPNLSTGGLSSGGTSGGLSSGGTTGGLSSGGSTGGLSSGGTSGGLSSGGTTGGYTPPPTFNPNALGEVVGQNCRYDRGSARINYDVTIQNSSSEHAFTYSFTVAFRVGTSPSSTIATRTLRTDYQTVTVNAGGDRTVRPHASYSTNDRFVYSCQVTSARKSLAR